MNPVKKVSRVLAGVCASSLFVASTDRIVERSSL
jgi:hypothetical protein